MFQDSSHHDLIDPHVHLILPYTCVSHQFLTFFSSSWVRQLDFVLAFTQNCYYIYFRFHYSPIDLLEFV